MPMLRFHKSAICAKAAFFWAVFALTAFVISADAQTRRKPQPKPKAKPAAKPQAGKQAPPIVVKLVEDPEIREIIKPRGRPLLINFWATWCDPCREEFPDLVEIDRQYKGKIDFITISLDDPEDIKTRVPLFLASMKAEMPAYLLHVADEGEVISLISPDWRGGMPFTALFASDGKLAYFREGKVVAETLRAEIEKLISVDQSPK